MGLVEEEMKKKEEMKEEDIEDDEDLEDGPHRTNIRHADKNFVILKNQLKKLGVQPLEYITLAQIQSQLEVLFAQVNAGLPYDEGKERCCCCCGC